MTDPEEIEPALLGLAENPALPPELLDRLIAAAPPAVLSQLGSRADLSAGRLRALVDRGGSEVAIELVRRGRLRPGDVPRADVRVVITAVAEGILPSGLVAEIVDHPDPDVRAAIAACPDLPAGVLARLAGDSEVEVAEAAALSPALTDDVARLLARHPHLTVRRLVARNERTPPALLALLASDRGADGVRRCDGCDGTDCDGTHQAAVWGLHYALADNPATPAAAAATFVDHPSAVVRWTLAARTDQTDATYRRLAADPAPGVRADLAGNPAIGEALIRAMAADRTYGVQRSLAHNPALPLDVLPALAAATKIGPTLLPRIAAAVPDELEALTRSPEPVVRMLVAQRPDLPAHLAGRLAADPDAKVLASVAPNPALTEPQLRAMLAGHGVRVAARIAANPTCSPGLLTDLAARRPSAHRAYRAVAAHPNSTGEALIHCLDDPSARPIAARHPALPADVLVSLLDDPDPNVAENAAANPSLPPPAMASLLDRLTGKVVHGL